MRKVIDWVAKRDSLRQTAESFLPDPKNTSEGQQPTEMLVNELLIHKVELEVQIEELRRVNTEMEESRDRYVELYDYSPVGYLTINRSGMIEELNLRASQLLGIDRLNSRYERFSSYMITNDQDKWNQYFVQIMAQVLPDAQPLLINLTRADTTVVSTQLICHRSDSPSGEPCLRVTLIDLSQVFEPPATTALA